MTSMQTELTTIGIATTIALFLAALASAVVLIRLWSARLRATKSSSEAPINLATATTIILTVGALVALNTLRA